MIAPHTIRTWLSERLGIRYPILQAPMAGGPTTPALVAAVGRAGALGAFGFAYTEPAAMRAAVETARAIASVPIHINLFVDPQPLPPSKAAIDAALHALAPMYEALGAPVPSTIDAPYAPDLAAQIDAALELKPAVLSSHFGHFSPDVIARARAQGTLIAGSATNLDDAIKLEQLGADFVIAQGAEAGGHRGIASADAHDMMIGTLALARIIARNCTIPIVAAGGIMDGEGLAAVIALGACGAQMGTAFLPVDESGAPAAHRASLFDRAAAGTAITRAFSGRPARGIRNRYIERTDAPDFPLLPFPIQNKATGPMRAAAGKQGNADYMSLWAGQAYSLARKMSAQTLIVRIAEEYETAMQRLLKAVRG